MALSADHCGVDSAALDASRPSPGRRTNSGTGVAVNINI